MLSAVSKTLCFVSICLFSISCEKDCGLESIPTGTLRDKGGNVYGTITIGERTWMSANLISDYYPNADSISMLLSDSSWQTNTDGYTFYDGTAANEAYYGKLYNYNAAKNACPEEWHLPAEQEWDDLLHCLGGPDVAGNKMKVLDNTIWFPQSDTSNTNKSQFNAAPGGFRDEQGEYHNLRYYGYYWTADESGDEAVMKSFHYGSPTVSSFSISKSSGASVRCIKD